MLLSKHYSNAGSAGGKLTLFEEEELISHLRFRRAEAARVSAALMAMGYHPRKSFEEFNAQDLTDAKRANPDGEGLHEVTKAAPLINNTTGRVLSAGPGKKALPVYWAVVAYAAWVAADNWVQKDHWQSQLGMQHQRQLQEWEDYISGLEAGAHAETLGRSGAARGFGAEENGGLAGDVEGKGDYFAAGLDKYF